MGQTSHRVISRQRLLLAAISALQNLDFQWSNGPVCTANPVLLQSKLIEGEMNSANINDWMQIIGIFSLVASLIFVGLQLRQTQDIAVNERRYAQADRGFEAESIRYQYAEIWVRGNAGDELDNADAMIYDGLVGAEYRNAFWDSATQRQLGGDGGRALQGFAWFLYRNPGARESWESGVTERRKYWELLNNENGGLTIEIQDVIYADLDKPDQLNLEQ